MANSGISKVGGGNVTVLPPQRETTAASHRTAAGGQGAVKKARPTAHQTVNVEGKTLDRTAPRGTHLDIVV